MFMVTSTRIAFTAVVLGALAGCSSVGRFEGAPAQGIDLSGNWTIDRTLSENPKPIIEKLRPKPMKPRWDMGPEESGDEMGPPEGGGRQGGGSGGGGGRSRRGGGQQGPQLMYRNNNDAYTHSTVLKVLMADIARADNLTVRQSAESFALDYGSAVRSFTPGAVSVVSAAWGVADQSSGWKGKAFVIQVRPQTGVASVETFTLADEGKHLIEELQLGGGEFPSVKLKRVYDRTDHPVQRSVPMTDE